MIRDTEYLFGHTRDRYEPELTRLATLRIADATLLMKRLAQHKCSANIKRYQAVEKAKHFWELILQEE